MRVLAIADDLTGALEAGAQFAARGIEPVVATDDKRDEAPVLVVDTESRHLSPDAAAAVVARCAEGWRGLIYKKTDSTLRGNIAAELRALPNCRIAYVPAYPAMGRTIRDGRLLVDGVPVEETAFARDALNPVLDGRVELMVEGLDAVVFEDVELAADTIVSGGFGIVAGPAAIAGALARRWSDRRPNRIPWLKARRALVLNGSRHPASARQVETAIRSGCLPEGWRVVGSAGLQPGPDCDALVVFGGDTAFGVVDAMGRPLLRPLGEILPGVPVSRIDGSDTLLITKAGGFGDDDLLCRLVRATSSQP